MKAISKPLVVPVCKLDSLSDIPKTDFPFYYKPYFEGAELYIRDGHVFFGGIDERVKNIAVIEELQLIRELSINLQAIIKLTISSDIAADYIYYKLKEAYYVLPKDCVFNFTELIIKRNYNDMGIVSGDANLKLISGGFKNRSNWKFHTHELAHAKSDFVNDATPILYLENVIGFTVYKPGAVFSNLKGYPIVNITVAKEEDVTILKIDSDVEKHKHHLANLATRLLVRSGSSVVEVNLKNLNQKVRKELWRARGYFKGKKVKGKVIKAKNIDGLVIKKVKIAG